MTNLKILFCASEVSPYAKTGGLADVIGALPGALSRLGCDVRVFMPLYRSIRRQLKPHLKLVGESVSVRMGVHDLHVHFWESTTPSGVPIYFLEKEEFFDRSYLYGSPVR